MHDHPGLCAFGGIHLDQLVDHLAANFRFPNDLLQFFVKKLVAACPINARMGHWKEKF